MSFVEVDGHVVYMNGYGTAKPAKQAKALQRNAAVSGVVSTVEEVLKGKRDRRRQLSVADRHMRSIGLELTYDQMVRANLRRDPEPSTEAPTVADSYHFILDAFGAVPGFGEPADALNGLWYAAEGNEGAALTSAAGLFSVLGDAGKVARHADEMAAVRSVGRAGEEASGITKNTTRIESLTKTAAYRIPDSLGEGGELLIEVKNVQGKISYTNQLKDFVLYAEREGIPFELRVRAGTRFTRPLEREILSGRIRVSTYDFEKGCLCSGGP